MAHWFQQATDNVNLGRTDLHRFDKMVVLEDTTALLGFQLKLAQAGAFSFLLFWAVVIFELFVCFPLKLLLRVSSICVSE